MKFKRALGFKAIANVVVWIMLAGGVVFTAGFGLCLMIARQEVTKEVDAKVGAQINYLRAYVDGRLPFRENQGEPSARNPGGFPVSGRQYRAQAGGYHSSSGAEQSDDITMLAITYRGNGTDWHEGKCAVFLMQNESRS